MELYKQYEFLIKENQCIEKEQSKIRVAINNFENKKNENNIVKSELALLDDEDIVYKLIGPILVQQDISDAKLQVDSRIEIINKEIHKLEKNYQTNSKNMEANRQKISDIQAKLIQLSKQVEQQMKKEGK
jgi:prefoldin beta subunit